MIVEIGIEGAALRDMEEGKRFVAGAKKTKTKTKNNFWEK